MRISVHSVTSAPSAARELTGSASAPQGGEAVADVLQRLQRLAKVNQRWIGDQLAEEREIDVRSALQLLAQCLCYPVLDTPAMEAMSACWDVLPLARALQRGCVVLREPGGALVVVFSEPFDTALIDWLDHIADEPVRWCLALPSDILAYLNKQESVARAIDTAMSVDADTAREEANIEVLDFTSASEALSASVRLASSTLYDAIKVGASDVHIESTGRGLTIKYRIDGVLDQAATVPGADLAEQVVSRIKVLAELDISERRVPQDGSFRVHLRGRRVDLRVSVMPSIHGEDVVIRILDKRDLVERQGSLTLDALGFAPDSITALRALARLPYGMLLVAGPTGSGKTTTLYAALSEINDGRDKLITIEDPVEYQLEGILQVPVNDRKGMTFAKGLRSILRHDPDKIMVGEIRDQETAEIAVQSALTGHLVLTTVHANSAFDVFGRFAHMGLDPYSFVSALNGVWAQRLIRINCTVCLHEHAPSLDEQQVIARHCEGHPSRLNFAQVQWRRGSGCGECRGSGYRGRVAVAELLVLDDLLRELVINQRPIREIKEAAKQQGVRSLYDVALDLVAAGKTTIEEVRRVTLAA